MWLVRVSVMLAVVQCASRAGGSPRFPTRRTPPFFWAWASRPAPSTTAATASAARTKDQDLQLRMRRFQRLAFERRCSIVGSGRTSVKWSPALFLQPDVLEPYPLQPVVEALHVAAQRVQAVEIPIAGHRDLL